MKLEQLNTVMFAGRRDFTIRSGWELMFVPGRAVVTGVNLRFDLRGVIPTLADGPKIRSQLEAEAATIGLL